MVFLVHGNVNVAFRVIALIQQNGVTVMQIELVDQILIKIQFLKFYLKLHFVDWQEDTGDIREKEYLPVKAVRFGDTGTPLDEKQGRYTLGALNCEGDDLFNNVVTFRIVDATINLPPFDMGHSGDIYFEFKTTIENAVLFHAQVHWDLFVF